MPQQQTAVDNSDFQLIPLPSGSGKQASPPQGAPQDNGDFQLIPLPGQNKPQAPPAPPAAESSRDFGVSTSLIKTATGKSLGERYQSGVIEHLDQYIPSWVKSIHGGDYAAKLAAYIGKMAPDAADFMTSPGGAALGLLHVFPKTRLLAGAIDLGLAAYQATKVPESVREARRDPTPENVARAIVEVGTVAGAATGAGFAARRGVAALPASSARAAAFKAAGRGAMEWFAGVSETQQLKNMAEQTIGHRRAVGEQEMAQAQELMLAEHRRVANLPKQEQLNIIFDIEQQQGLDPLSPTAPRKTRATMVQRDPQNQWVAETMSKLVDTEWDKIIALNKPGLDRHFYETYFPRFWKDPDKAQSWVADWYSKRPFSGRETFKQHRTYPTLEEALADPNFKMELITTNPVELSLLKLKELKKFRTAQEAILDLKDRGQLQFVKLGDRIPDGWKPIDDKSFRVGPRGVAGDIVAPAPIATTINNYLSPGLAKIAKDTLVEPLGSVAAGGLGVIRGFNNATNIANVAFSGFHPFLESGVSMLNSAALGIKQIASGKPGKGAVSIAKSFGLAPIEDFFIGRKFRQEYKRPGSHPELTPLVEAYTKGAGRVRMETLLKDRFSYRSRYFDAAFEAMRKQADKLHAAPMVDTMRWGWNFTMETLVPNIKAGAFSRMARYEMERLAPELSRLSPRQALDLERSTYSKLSDAIDDRHGQLIYDNLYWHNAWKDIAFLSTHFLGWTYGSIRAGAGGVLDIARQPARIALGLKPELTHRAAWVMAMPFVYGTMNALYQYYMSGQPPTQVEDLIFPKNGKTKPDGTAERDTLPMSSYLKDYYDWVTRFQQTGVNKLSNALVSSWDLFVTNKDYLGRDIRNPDEPAVKQALQVLQYLGERATPISVQSYLQTERGGEGSGLEAAARSAAGIRNSPAFTMRSSLQNYIIEREPHRTSPLDMEEYDHKQRSKQLLEGILNGKSDIDKAHQAADEGKISMSDLKRIVHDSNVDPWSRFGIWGRQFDRLNAKQALAAWKLATDEEREKIMPLFVRIMFRANKDIPDPKKRDEIQDEMQHAIDTFNPRGGESPPR